MYFFFLYQQRHIHLCRLSSL